MAGPQFKIYQEKIEFYLLDSEEPNKNPLVIKQNDQYLRVTTLDGTSRGMWDVWAIGILYQEEMTRMWVQFEYNVVHKEGYELRNPTFLLGVVALLLFQNFARYLESFREVESQGYDFASIEGSVVFSAYIALVLVTLGSVLVQSDLAGSLSAFLTVKRVEEYREDYCVLKLNYRIIVCSAVSSLILAIYASTVAALNPTSSSSSCTETGSTNSSSELPEPRKVNEAAYLSVIVGSIAFFVFAPLLWAWLIYNRTEERNVKTGGMMLDCIYPDNKKNMTLLQYLQESYMFKAEVISLQTGSEMAKSATVHGTLELETTSTTTVISLNKKIKHRLIVELKQGAERVDLFLEEIKELTSQKSSGNLENCQEGNADLDRIESRVPEYSSKSRTYNLRDESHTDIEEKGEEEDQVENNEKYVLQLEGLPFKIEKGIDFKSILTKEISNN